MRSLLFSTWLGLGLILPGWLLGRVLRARAGLAGAVIGSAVIVMYLLVALAMARVRLTAGNVSVALFGVLAGLAAAEWWRNSRSPVVGRTDAGWNWPPFHWLALPATLGCAALVWRVLVDPLSGADTGFRWSFLAEQIVRTGSLDFYPPVTAGDYEVYGWSDGIAPLVSGLYFLAYAGLAQPVAWATSPAVLLQVAALYVSVYRLAQHRAGTAAGWSAIALLGTSAVLLNGVAMGQETGLTALTLVAMFEFIERHRCEPERPWLVWAGIAAGAGGLAREYGLLYPALGAVALATARVTSRDYRRFLGAAIVVAVPWYLRNWIKTGNPVYSYDVAGWFPTNRAHLDNFHAVTEVLGVGVHPGTALLLLGFVASLAGIPLVLAFSSGWRLGRPAWTWLGAVGAVVAVWAWTAGQTGGGYLYSLRVLTPALALSAAVAGWGLAPWARSRRAWILAVLLTVPIADATARLAFILTDPTGLWWRKEKIAWREHRDAARAWHTGPAWGQLAAAAQGEKILCTDPYDYTDLSRQGGRPVPLFSPEVQFLLSPAPDFAAAIAELRRHQFRFVVVSRENAVTERQLARYPFFGALRQTPPRVVTALYEVYDLAQLAPAEERGGLPEAAAAKKS